MTFCKRNTFNLGTKPAYWALLLGFLFTGICFGQSVSTNSGTDFWFGYTETNDGVNASYVVYINTFKTTNGTVSIPGAGWSTNFTAVPGVTTRIVLPSADVVVTSFTGPVNEAVNVVADSNISVFAAIEFSERSDNSCILPVSLLGNQYYVEDYTLCQSFSEFMVVAQGCKDSVEIIPSQNITVGGSHPAGVPYTEVLSPGQVLLVQSNSDLTGSEVISLNHSETGIMAGANWNCVYCSGTANPFYEELLPENTWGENYVFLPTAQAQDQCRVLSEQNGTVVTFYTNSGNNIQTLNAGQYYDTTVNYATPVYINSTNPVSVGRFMRTGTCNDYYITNPSQKGDPAMVIEDANEQMFLDSIVFYVSRTPDIDSTYIQVVTRTADKNTVFLDGVNIGAFFTTLVPNPTYAYASLTILPGSHTLTTTGQGFVAYTCGLGNLDAMAEAAGVYLQEITINTSATSPSICSASDGTATANPSGIPPFIYSWSNGQTTQTATGLSAGIYTVTVSDSDCVPHKATAIVNISGHIGYTASVTDTNPSCTSPMGNSTVYPSGGTSPYTYNWNNGETTQTATGLIAGSYTCTVTDNLGCQYFATASISAYTPPGIGIAPYNDSSCGPPNEVLHVYGLNTGIYNWSPSTGLSCNICPSPTASPTVTTTYTISGADSNGCSASATVTLTVLGTPKPIVKGRDSICPGYSDTLSATGGSTYTWSGGGTTDTVYRSPATTKTYTVTASNGYCPSHDTTFTIYVVSPAATITASKDSICLGDSSQLTASGGLSYRWSTGKTTTSIWATPLITTTYTLYASEATCSDSATQTIKIIPQITASISAFPDSICKHGTSILTATGAGGQATYKWNTGATTSSITVSDSVNTTYTATVYGICDSVVKTVTVSIIPAPNPVIAGTLSKCKGLKDTLTISGGNTYKWSTGATTTSIYVSDTGTTTYTATVYGVCDTTQKTITITAYPTPDAIITGTSSKCKGFTDTLTVSGGNTYLWSNGTTNNKYYTGVIDADSIITVIAYSSFGCPDTTHYDILLSPSPNVTLTPPTTDCSGSSVTLDAKTTGVGPFNYLWSPNGQTTQSITVNPDSVTSYTVVVSNGCIVTQTTTVTPDNPTLNACCDKTILLGDDTTIVASGSSTKPYQWSPQVNCLNPPLCDSVDVTPTVTTTYTVTITDSLGCPLDKIITIVVEEPCMDFTVPNVFTPTNSGTLGLDNVFYIKTQHLSSWSILIYDRWGKEMFKSTNPDTYWKGNSESGGPAPAGIYYYVINATCQGTAYKKDGFVQLIR